MKKYSSLIFILLLIQGCSTESAKDDLSAIDIHRKADATHEVFVKSKSEEEIKNEYYQYVQNASAGDKTRRLAMDRLAEIEIKKINSISKDGNGKSSTNEEQLTDSLRKAQQIILRSLKDYPDAKDNDINLYQLARLSDQLEDQEQSIKALREITLKYPHSIHIAEAEFRIAEYEFMSRNYLAAEAAYSSAIMSTGNNEFYERALFKRGWSRFKQALFTDAADDYLAALEKHQFAEYAQLNQTDKDQYDEYIHALGLSLASLQNEHELHTYAAEKIDPKYTYASYKSVVQLYLEQERYADAAETMDEFIKNYSEAPELPIAEITSLDIWQMSKFKQRYSENLTQIYEKYIVKSSYWGTHNNAKIKDDFISALRPHILNVATIAQEDYQISHANRDLEAAKKWYARYLEQYASFAHQDKVYSMYAELLVDSGNTQDALMYFEKVAYDGDIILDKESAYATITETSKLFAANSNNIQVLKKHIHYVLLSTQLYQAETRYQKAALHALELATTHHLPSEAIQLADSLSRATNDQLVSDANYMKGLAYLQLNNFVGAETIFGDLIKHPNNQESLQKISDNLALSIYKQADAFKKEKKDDLAAQQFARIAKRAPKSDIAPKSLYEAIALSMATSNWSFAINCIQDFQQLYPTHELNKDATKQLSIAYLNAGDSTKAAQTFEKMASQDGNQDIKMASLWKAAELYESKGNTESAASAYANYVQSYTRPFPQYIEAMYKLTQLYGTLNQKDKVNIWQNEILSADKLAGKDLKTDRTNFIVANISIANAEKIQQQFELVKLTEPLAENLKTKKKYMQDAIAAYSQTSAFNNPDVITQATYKIANIYKLFSEALLKSERPKNLQGEELEQYNILIEDQAFPFEEKAIEFYEINLSHTKEGVTNEWISRSLENLTKLYPVRYNRTGKLDVY